MWMIWALSILMLLSLFDPPRLKVRVLRLQMVGSQLPHSQPTTSSVRDGILAPTVAQIHSPVGISMLTSIVHNNQREVMPWDCGVQCSKTMTIFKPLEWRHCPNPTYCLTLYWLPSTWGLSIEFPCLEKGTFKRPWLFFHSRWFV